jgi:hypothetical protein
VVSDAHFYIINHYNCGTSFLLNFFFCIGFYEKSLIKKGDNNDECMLACLWAGLYIICSI